MHQPFHHKTKIAFGVLLLSLLQGCTPTEKAPATPTSDSGAPEAPRGMSIGKDTSGPLTLGIFHNFDKSAATHIQFSNNGNYLATGDAEGNVSVWNVETGKLVKKVKQHDKSVTSLCWDNNDNVISSSSSGDVKVWSASSGKLLQTLKLDSKEKGPIYAAGFIPSGERIIAGGDKGLVNVWNKKTSALEKSIVVFPPEANTSEASVTDIQVSPTGKYIALCNGSSIRIMDPKTLDTIFDKFTKNLNEFNKSGKLGDAFFLYDDRLMVSTESGLSIWDLRSGRKMNDLGPSIAIEGIYSGTQWSIGCVSGSKPEMVQFQTGNHRVIQNSDPEALPSAVSIDVDPAGKMIALAGDKGVQIWAVSKK